MLEPSRICDALSQLNRAQPVVFGSNSHRFQVNLPLNEVAICSFESRHRLYLPSEYRQFLQAVGNGGAGPFYGIFELGTMKDPGWNNGKWEDEVGVLAAPFPYVLETPCDGQSLVVIGPQGYRRPVDDPAYFDDTAEPQWLNEAVDGAIPICHIGCGYLIWLVVSGEASGQIWHDERAAGSVFGPVLKRSGEVSHFGEWYQAWLDEACSVL